MAQKYGLFNSVGGSPAYADVDLANMLSLITNHAGYVVGYKNELAVTAGAGFQVIVDTGGAWLGDPPGWWYINDEALTLDIDAEVSGYSRIDRVVLKLNRNSEALSVTAEIKKGTPAVSSHVAPSLTQNSTVFEISLAQVLITGGSTAIVVTDERGSIDCEQIILNGTPDAIEESSSFELDYKHVGKLVNCNSASDIEITIPSNATKPLKSGVNTCIAFLRVGAGSVSFIPADEVTLRAPYNANKITVQYAPCTLTKIGTNTWLLAGNVT
mgnify:CR=1 FL=1